MFSSKIQTPENASQIIGKYQNHPKTPQCSPRNDLKPPERTKLSFSESRFLDFSAYSAQKCTWVAHFPQWGGHKIQNLDDFMHGHSQKILSGVENCCDAPHPDSQTATRALYIYIYLYIQSDRLFSRPSMRLFFNEKRLRRDYSLISKNKFGSYPLTKSIRYTRIQHR